MQIVYPQRLLLASGESWAVQTVCLKAPVPAEGSAFPLARSIFGANLDPSAQQGPDLGCLVAAPSFPVLLPLPQASKAVRS